MSSLQPDNTEHFLFGDIYIMHPREWIFHNTGKKNAAVTPGRQCFRKKKQVTIFSVDGGIFFIAVDIDLHETLLSKD